MTIALILFVLGVVFIICCVERFIEDDGQTDDQLVAYWTAFNARRKYAVLDEFQPNGNDPLAGGTWTYTVYDDDGARIKDFIDYTPAINYADKLNGKRAA